MYRSSTLIAIGAAVLVVAIFASFAPVCLMPNCAIYGLMGITTDCGQRTMVEVIPVAMLVALTLLFVAILVFTLQDFVDRYTSGFVPAYIQYVEPPPLDRLSTRLRI